jgi:hypothetical protein
LKRKNGTKEEKKTNTPRKKPNKICVCETQMPPIVANSMTVMPILHLLKSRSNIMLR